MPLRFVRIRHYGIFSSTGKGGKLQCLQLELKVKKAGDQMYKTLHRKCHCCKTGTLITIEVFGKRGPPKEYFMESQTVPAS